jgi:2-C-methyl-D-erythritol 4-phosphate cytidylyltransferase
MPTDARDVCAIIVAPEQDGDLIWREVAGRPMLTWSIAAFAAAPSIARILLVVPEAQAGHVQAICEQAPWEKVSAVLPGGARRRDSVEAALRALPDECSLVAIDDALRPLVTTALIEVGVALARETGAAIPVEPVKETIKRVRDGVIIGFVPRERLTRAQSPRFYSLPLLQEAYQRAAPDLDPPDEAALLLAADLPVSCYAGDTENLRVTSVDELPVVEELLRRRPG